MLGPIGRCRVCHRKAPKWHRRGTLTARCRGRSRDGWSAHLGTRAFKQAGNSFLVFEGKTPKLTTGLPEAAGGGLRTDDSHRLTANCDDFVVWYLQLQREQVAKAHSRITLEQEPGHAEILDGPLHRDYATASYVAMPFSTQRYRCSLDQAPLEPSPWPCRVDDQPVRGRQMCFDDARSTKHRLLWPHDKHEQGIVNCREERFVWPRGREDQSPTRLIKMDEVALPQSGCSSRRVGHQ